MREGPPCPPAPAAGCPRSGRSGGEGGSVAGHLEHPRAVPLELGVPEAAEVLLPPGGDGDPQVVLLPVQHGLVAVVAQRHRVQDQVGVHAGGALGLVETLGATLVWG